MYSTKQQKPQQLRVIQSTNFNHALQRVVLTRSMQKIVDETYFHKLAEIYTFYNLFIQKYRKEIVIEMINRIIRPYKVSSDGNSFYNSDEIQFSGGYMGKEVDDYNYNEDFNTQDDEVDANISYHGDLNEYDDGQYVDNYISDLYAGTIQLARKGNTISGPKSYSGTCGYYDNIAYKTGNKGDIDFNNPYQGTVFGESVLNGSLVNLPKTIDKSNRQQHFAIADKELAKNRGWQKPSDATNFRKGKYTWHHLLTPHQMILVDMTVHAKHGHNGGVYLW